jgi:hypothetical protein
LCEWIPLRWNFSDNSPGSLHIVYRKSCDRTRGLRTLMTMCKLSRSLLPCPSRGALASLGLGPRTASEANGDTVELHRCGPSKTVSEVPGEANKLSLAVALARGSSIRRWARVNNVPWGTAWSWAHEPQDRRTVETLRRLAINQAVGVLAGRTGWAAGPDLQTGPKRGVRIGPTRRAQVRLVRHAYCFEVLRPGRAHGSTPGACRGASRRKLVRSPNFGHSMTMGKAHLSFPYFARRGPARQPGSRAENREREIRRTFVELVSPWDHFAPCKKNLRKL